VADGSHHGRPGALPGGRRLFDVAMAHAIAEYAAWIAILVVAFERGGAGASALVVAVQLVPAAVTAPFVAAAGDRFPRHLVLRIALLVLSASALAIALTLQLRAPIALTYGLAVVFTIALSATPTTLASLLVHHAVSPAQLTRWNAASAVVRWGGNLLGPLLTAVVLATAGPSVVFLGIAAICIAALGLGWTVPADDRSATPLRLRDVASDSWQGVRYAISQSDTRRTVGFLTLAQVVVGGLDVVFLAVVFDQLGQSGDAAALVTAGFAAGGVAMSVVIVRQAHRSPISLAVLGSVLLTVPLVVLGELTSLVAVLALVATLGAGSSLAEIGGHTLLQRVSPETMTSRVAGVLDSTSMAATAVGALLAGVALSAHDPRIVYLAFGLLGLAGLLAGAAALSPVQRAAAPVDTERVELLRRIPFFTPLPLPTLERLSRSMDLRQIGPGRAIIEEDTVGHEFYVLLDGAADVSAAGRTIERLESPSYFGEVALVRDAVRNASVIAVSDCTVGVIDRGPFLDAVARTPSSTAAADEVSRQRSAERRPGDGTR